VTTIGRAKEGSRGRQATHPISDVSTAGIPTLTSGMGVYAVRNLVDGAVYVDSAADIGARWDEHRAALEGSGHPNDADARH